MTKLIQYYTLLIGCSSSRFSASTKDWGSSSSSQIGLRKRQSPPNRKPGFISVSLLCATREKLSQSVPLCQEKPIPGIKLSSAETPGAPAGCWESIDPDKQTELGITAGGGQTWGQAAGRHRLVCPLLPATPGNPKLWGRNVRWSPWYSSGREKGHNRSRELPGERRGAGNVCVGNRKVWLLTLHCVSWAEGLGPAPLRCSGQRTGSARRAGVRVR